MNESWLVFLHGINDRGETERWLETLDTELSLVGSVPFSRDRIVLPDYRAFLRGESLADGLPSHPVTWTRPPEAGERTAVIRYLSTSAFLEDRLETVASRVQRAGLPEVPSVPPSLPIVEQARRYARDRRVRENVHHEVLTALEAIPAGSQVVILAHSLGTVVAVDILKRLPPGLVIEALLTVGSPLGAVKELRAHHDLKDFPYDRVHAWVNVFETRDIVTGGKGISRHYPAAIDRPVELPDPHIPFLLGQHGAEFYCAHPCIASAVTGVLVGRAVAKVDQSPRLRAEGLELLLLQATYLRELAKQIPTSQHDRFAALDRARRLTAESHSATSAQLAKAQSKVSVLPPSAFLTRPHDYIRGVWDDQTLLALATMMASALPAAPFAVEAKPDTPERRKALRETLEAVRRANDHPTEDEMADAVFEARERAVDCLSPAGSKYLLPGILIGVGVVTLAATGVGLALVAPAGVVGAALLTSTLAAFGPGGMVGGMATLAALAGAGSAMAAAGVSIGLASPDRSAPNLLAVALDEVIASSDPEQLRALLMSLHALVEAQETLGFDSQRIAVLNACSEAEARLAVRVHQHAHVDPKSQPAKSARTMLEILRKLSACLRGEAGCGADVAPEARSGSAAELALASTAFEQAFNGSPAGLRRAPRLPQLMRPDPPS